MDNGGKIIAAFLAGAAAGASLGLLLAPDKGTTTRSRIVDSLEEITEKANEQLDKLKKKKSEYLQEEEDDE